MLLITQWPLKRAAHFTSLVLVCVLWRPESLMDLSALWVSFGFAGNCYLINFLQVLGKCWPRPNILLNQVNILWYCDVDLFLQIFSGLVINRMYPITHVVKLYGFSVIVLWLIPLWLFWLQGSRKSSTVKCGYSMVRFSRHCNNTGRVKVRFWTHNRHPIPHPHRLVKGCLL